jgi:hypothetical protein
MQKKFLKMSQRGAQVHVSAGSAGLVVAQN